MKKIGIIGAGVVGLGCGIRILEAYPSAKVTIITKDITPNTTGDGSAGLWGPYLLNSTPADKVMKWSQETHDLYYQLWKDGIAGSCLIPCMRIADNVTPLPIWKDIVYGFHEMNSDDMQRFKAIYSRNLKSGYSFVTYTCEPPLLLPYLMERFHKNGGKIERRHVKSIDEVTEYFDIVINCTGLGARSLVPDETVIPIRGQIARVKAPWINHIILDDSDDGRYIIPNTDSVVIGGTHQVNDWNQKIDRNDTKFIRDGCEVMVPGLKNVGTHFEWVGLRPGRDSVRLEREDTYADGRKKTIIHNYGHGGSGLTLFWGCARDVVDMLSDDLRHVKSHL